MNRIEHYHDWLRDAHAMEKQAESMLESMASRIDNYPELRARIEQHLSETKNQIVQLETILDRNDISRSVIKDSMSKMAALGQSIGGIFPSDEIVKGSISGYVFEQFEIACYTSLLACTVRLMPAGLISVKTGFTICRKAFRILPASAFCEAVFSLEN